VFGTARGPVEESFKTMQPLATDVFDTLNIRRESDSVEMSISEIVSTLINGSSIQSRRGSFASVEVSRPAKWELVIRAKSLSVPQKTPFEPNQDDHGPNPGSNSPDALYKETTMSLPERTPFGTLRKRTDLPAQRALQIWPGHVARFGPDDGSIGSSLPPAPARK
jgi:hypothetical protein